MHRPDLRGTLRTDRKAEVAIKVVDAGRRVLFQARDVEVHDETGAVYRIRSFATARARLGKDGTFDIDRYRFTSSGLGGETQTYYRVHGRISSDAEAAHGFLLYSHDDRATAPTGVDSSTVGKRAWRATAAR